jgi:hypothetical protein
MEYVLFYTRLMKILPDGYHLLSGYNVLTNSLYFPCVGWGGIYHPRSQGMFLPFLVPLDKIEYMF